MLGLRRPQPLLVALPLAAVVAVCASAPALAADASVYGSTTMIRPTDAGTGTATAEVTAARNEFESFQVKIAGPLDAVDVTLQTPLSRVGGGGSIPAANVQIFREGYYTVGRPSDGEMFTADPCTGECRVPDVLIPDRDVFDGEQRDAFTHANFTLDIPAGENRVAWIDVLVPQGAAAGRYEGVLRVTGTGFSEDVPIGLEVIEATLPSTSSLEGAFSITFQKLCPAHGNCPGVDPWALYARYARLALEHRVSLDRPAYGNPADARWRTEADPLLTGTSPARLPAARLTGIVLNTFYAAIMDDYKLEAARLGILDKLAFYCDETGRDPNLWNACDDAYDAAKVEWEKAAPAVPMHMAKIGTIDDLAWAKAEGFGVAHAVDRLIPIINFFAPRDMDYPGTRASYEPYLAERERNDLWAYGSCMSSGCTDVYTNHPVWHGWPGYHIDQPASEARAMPWLLHTHDVAGEYYFEMVMDLSTAWGGCAGRPLGCLYNEGGNGDGTLFYPGTPDRIGGTTHIPVESIRLKRIREGREDYEWLELAGAADHAADARTIARGLFPKMIDGVATQGEIDAARAALVPLISGAAPPATPQCHGSTVTDLSATAGDDLISGGPAVDVLSGLGGNDLLEGFPENDKLCGDAGNDTLRPGNGDDIIDGGTGTDVVDFVLDSGAVSVDLGIGMAGGPAGFDDIIAVEDVLATSGDDIVIGSEAPNTLSGLGGVDSLTGGPGADTLSGGAGDDWIDARDGEVDQVTCGDGVDEVEADAVDAVAGDCETVTLPAGAQCQGQEATLTGTAAANILTGGPVADAIAGLGGDDQIAGVDGDDALCGDDGYDTLFGGLGDDVLDGGAGADIADFFNAPGPVIADLAGGTATGEGADLLVAVSDLAGGDFNDVLSGSDTANYLVGRAGHDDLAGLAGNDRLDGGDGNDTLRGGPGNDRLDGEAGQDELSYELSATPVAVDLAAGTATGEGTDTLFGFEDVTGSAQNDVLTGDGGTSFIAGLAGHDAITGGPAFDFLSGGDGNDVMQAADGEVDRVACGMGIDRAVVDTDDIVEADCEEVERPLIEEPVIPTPTPTPSPTPTPTPVATDTTPPTLTVRVRSARRGRIVMSVRCSERCTTTTRATLSARDARRLGLRRRLGSARGTGTEFRLTIRLGARARARVRRARSVRFTLSAVALDAAGNRASARRLLRLRR